MRAENRAAAGRDEGGECRRPRRPTTGVNSCSTRRSRDFVLIDQFGTITGANAWACRMFGFEAEAEIIGMPIFRLLPEASPLDAGLGLGLEGVRRDGVRFPVDARFTMIERDDETIFLATVFDLAERRSDQHALALRTAELQSVNERLARFAFVASQDLQEPLRKIAAFGELMDVAIARGDCAEIRHANQVMRRSALHARDLVHDLLAFSRIVNDELDLGVLDLQQAIDLALAELSQPIVETQARINIRLPAVSIEADPVQFRRLVSNIVSNAIKYRKPGAPATIDITGFRDEAAVCLAIADDGIGFEEQYAHRIFEPLKRLHSKVDYPGSGIGLAICKAIADRHGWRISVEAKPGVGATFFIVLPICHSSSALPNLPARS